MRWMGLCLVNLYRILVIRRARHLWDFGLRGLLAKRDIIRAICGLVIGRARGICGPRMRTVALLRRRVCSGNTPLMM